MSRATAAVFATCVIGVAAPPTTRAAEIATGIYRIVPAGQGARVPLSSGGTVDLGERVFSNFGYVTVWSLSRTKTTASACG